MWFWLRGVVLQDAELCKQQGKAPLSASEMLLLDGSRQHLRAALDHARLGNIKEAHLQLIRQFPTFASSVLLCAKQRHFLVLLG